MKSFRRQHHFSYSVRKRFPFSGYLIIMEFSLFSKVWFLFRPGERITTLFLQLFKVNLLSPEWYKFMVFEKLISFYFYITFQYVCFITSFESRDNTNHSYVAAPSRSSIFPLMFLTSGSPLVIINIVVWWFSLNIVYMAHDEKPLKQSPFSETSGKIWFLLRFISVPLCLPGRPISYFSIDMSGF